MQPLGHEAMELFNEILASWRKQGRKLDWGSLNEAARLAREYQETQQREKER